jgi:hypothetical protein
VRRIRPPAAAVLGVLAVLALPAAASAAPPSNLVCNGTYAGTYASVTVPPNGNCDLFNATVLGSAVVLNGGNLNLANSDGVSNVTIKGSVVIDSNGNYSQYSSDSVGGAITAQGASAVGITGGTTHNIVVNASGSVEVTSTTVTGSVTVNQTQYLVYVAANPTITGDVLVNGTATGAVGEVTLNTVGGSVYLTNNQADPDYVYLNTIQRNLVCTGNNPPPSDNGQGNWVQGRQLGQCAGFANSPEDGAQEGG